jgi:hypothetical protein
MSYAPIYSALLLAESGFEGEAAFEVPEGITLIVRDIDVVAGISLGGQVWAYDTDGAQFWGYTFTEVTGGKVSAAWRGRQAIPGPGYFYVSTDFTCDFRASGYLLTGVAT